MCTISPDGVLERIEAAARPKEMACALDGYLATRLSRAGEVHPVDHAAQALAPAHAEAPPSRLITQLGLTGDDCFGRSARHRVHGAWCFA
jgi:hypothetical protein